MGTFVYPRGATFGPARLTDFEFVWVLDGSSTCTIVSSSTPGGTTTIPLTPGTLLLTRPGMTQTYRWSDRRSTEHGYVHFGLSAGGRPLQADVHAEWPLTRPVRGGGTTEALCRELVRRAPSSGPGSAAVDIALLDSLCETLLRTFLAADGAPGDGAGTLDRLADWLAAGWASAERAVAHPVADLAAAVHLSAGHLSRLTRAAFGTGPSAAVEIVRLERAAALLERTNLTLERIADDCGFAGPYYLSRRFRRAFGVPPSRFRDSPCERPETAQATPAQRAALDAWSVRVRSGPVHNPARTSG